MTWPNGKPLFLERNEQEHLERKNILPLPFITDFKQTLKLWQPTIKQEGVPSFKTLNKKTGKS
jgi:hypothetical protein